MNQNIKNALKEAARLIVFGVPAILIQVVSNDPTLSAYAGGLILVVLRSTDKAIHDSPSATNGLLPF